jgi:hypothetical protein
MIKILARLFRGLHHVVGVSAPPSEPATASLCSRGMSPSRFVATRVLECSQQIISCSYIERMLAHY